MWSKLQHENILPLLGITTDFEFTVSIVSPWIQTGNAFDYVQDEKMDSRPFVSTVSVIEGDQEFHVYQKACGDCKWNRLPSHS